MDLNTSSSRAVWFGVWTAGSWLLCCSFLYRRWCFEIFFYSYFFFILGSVITLPFSTLKGHQMHLCVRARACMRVLHVHTHTHTCFSPLICAAANMQMKRSWRTRRRETYFKIYRGSTTACVWVCVWLTLPCVCLCLCRRGTNKMVSWQPSRSSKWNRVRLPLEPPITWVLPVFISKLKKLLVLFNCCCLEFMFNDAMRETHEHQKENQI